MGYGSRRPTRLSLLTPRYWTQCLTWACTHSNWTLEDWQHVAWFDESHYQLLQSDGRVRVWCRPHETMDPNCQQGTVRAGSGSIFEWGVFTWHGLGPLVLINTPLISNCFVALMDDHLQSSTDFMYPNNDGIFQAYNAPCQWAKDGILDSSNECLTLTRKPGLQVKVKKVLCFHFFELFFLTW